MLCYSTLELIPIVGGKIQKRCLPVKERQAVRRTRSGGGDSVNLIEPYGSALIENRPTITWEYVAGAAAYRVKVEEAGSNFFWARTVEDTTLSYPSDIAPLRPGGVYTILVEPQGVEFSTLASKTVVSLGEAQRQKIDKALVTLKSNGVSADEQALDLEQVYRSQGLIQKSIGVLLNRIHSGTLNSEIYLILGDRYREEGFRELAKAQYQKTIEISTKQNQPILRSKAEKALLKLEAFATP
ncbi:hypothetical protein C1752_10560 [Acaryochloris thomasi RCC1774]|uniref:Tetratricopeptide repeat protein n=2 Tax=Acaryochloris TaxID=155977 RepID=A0A2W1J7Y3_9CYAN|nr:hypothetical protein C1752_10560 [Acaryochloris thomasi RCC1774]